MLSQYNITAHIKDNPIYYLLKDSAQIDFVDNNLKPYWVERPAQYTEFHVNRKRKNLLIVIGESWTYGEAVKGIATGIEKFNFETQLFFTLGPRMATMLDTDLYQYAVPGNCNFYMFTELERILKKTSALNYEKIYVCMQMTEPSREQSLVDELRNHPLHKLIKCTEHLTFSDWLERYDDIFFDQYQSIISQYNNLECVLWKNFCKINSKKQERNFKIVDKTWIQYSASILGTKLQAPSFYSVGWLDSIINDGSYKTVKFDKSLLLKEIDIIEQSNNFIKGNPLHSHHPNEFSHLLWAQYLIRKAGWKDDI